MAFRAGQRSSSLPVLRKIVERKVRRGWDRLPSQGPDPAITDATPNGWRIGAATILERYPVVIPDCHPFEQKYIQGRFLWESSVARPIPAEFFKSDRDGLQTSDGDSKVADMYEPASRQTEADERNDVRSLDRALPERLYYVVRRSAKSTVFQFPQTLVVDDNVSMRTYAEAALKASLHPKVSGDVRTHVVSHSPACHLEHEFSSAFQEKTGYYGQKMFFYRAQLLSGRIEESAHEDFMWARESELKDVLSKETLSAIRPVLVGVSPQIEFNAPYEEGEDCAQW